MSEERRCLRWFLELAGRHGGGGDGSLSTEAEGRFCDVNLSSEGSQPRKDLRKRHDYGEDEEEEEEGTAEEGGSCSFGRQLYEMLNGEMG